MRTLFFPSLALLLAACSPPTDGRWLGRCGTNLRIDLDVPDGDEAAPFGLLWSVDRPDDVMDFTCVRQAGGRKVVDLAECSGAWRSSGLTGPLNFTIDAKVEKGENLPSLIGTCALDGTSATLELLRVDDTSISSSDSGDTGTDTGSTAGSTTGSTTDSGSTP